MVSILWKHFELYFAKVPRKHSNCKLNHYPIIPDGCCKYVNRENPSESHFVCDYF